VAVSTDAMIVLPTGVGRTVDAALALALRRFGRGEATEGEVGVTVTGTGLAPLRALVTRVSMGGDWRYESTGLVLLGGMARATSWTNGQLQCKRADCNVFGGWSES
jgi:hypothetical protein